MPLLRALSALASGSAAAAWLLAFLSRSPTVATAHPGPGADMAGSIVPIGRDGEPTRKWKLAMERWEGEYADYEQRRDMGWGGDALLRRRYRRARCDRRWRWPVRTSRARPSPRAREASRSIAWAPRGTPRTRRRVMVLVRMTTRRMTRTRLWPRRVRPPRGRVPTSSPGTRPRMVSRLRSPASVSCRPPARRRRRTRENSTPS